MKKNKFAILFSLLITFFFVFSIFFIAHEVNHDCAGEDCIICEQIIICEKTLQELGTGIIAIVAISSMFFGRVYKIISVDNNKNKKDSLVSLKIEMLN